MSVSSPVNNTAVWVGFVGAAVGYIGVALEQFSTGCNRVIEEHPYFANHSTTKKVVQAALFALSLGAGGIGAAVGGGTLGFLVAEKWR